MPVDFEIVVSVPETSQKILARLIGELRGGACVLIRAHHDHRRVLGHDVHKADLALHRARRAFHVAEHHHTPFTSQDLDHALASQPAALVVVRGDEAHIVLAVEGGVDEHDRNAAPGGVHHRDTERFVVRRGQHDTRDAAAYERLDFGDLGLAVVLAPGAFPNHLDPKFLGCLHRAGVDGDPERVDGSLGNDGNRYYFVRGVRRLPATRSQKQ